MVLGRQIKSPIESVEAIPNPGVEYVAYTQYEFTSLCPVTGQPDYGTVTIQLEPDDLIIESKSLKLYLWKFRNHGAFSEKLAVEICDHIYTTIRPHRVSVVVEQNPRGGVGIKAEAYRGLEEEEEEP